MNDNKKYVDLPGLQDYDKGVKDALGKIQTKVNDLENEKDVINVYDTFTGGGSWPVTAGVLRQACAAFNDGKMVLLHHHNSNVISPIADIMDHNPTKTQVSFHTTNGQLIYVISDDASDDTVIQAIQVDFADRVTVYTKTKTNELLDGKSNKDHTHNLLEGTLETGDSRKLVIDSAGALKYQSKTVNDESYTDLGEVALKSDIPNGHVVTIDNPESNLSSMKVGTARLIRNAYINGNQVIIRTQTAFGTELHSVSEVYDYPSASDPSITYTNIVILYDMGSIYNCTFNTAKNDGDRISIHYHRFCSSEHKHDDLYATKEHTHDEYYTKTEIDTKNEEFSTDIQNVENSIQDLQGDLGNKANKTHTHELSNITNFFMGSYKEYETAYAAGSIPVGALVIITDDNESDDATSPILGTGKLDSMILG